MKKIVLPVAVIFSVLLLFCVIIGVVYISNTSTEGEKDKDIAINEENFPNMWVRREVSLQLDKDNDNSLSEKEINQATSMSLPIGDINTEIQPGELNQLSNMKQLLLILNGKGKKINLSGLEHIEEIEIRDYAEGQSEIALSKIKNLSSVKIKTKNEKCLAFFSLKDCPKIEEMDVEEGEGINRFALSDVPMMRKVTISGTSMTSLELHDLPGLENLEVNRMDKLCNLTLYNLPHIKELAVIYMPKLKQLDISKLKNLKRLSLSRSPLKKIDFSRCRELTEIVASEMDKMEYLDLINQKKLKSFQWECGNLKTIRWGRKEELTLIEVNENNLSGEWDLSKFPNLKELHFDNNSYEKIIGRNHKKIGYICCENNKLRLIDLRNSKIYRIAGYGNNNVIVYLPKKQKENLCFDDHFFEPEKDIGPNATVYYI